MSKDADQHDRHEDVNDTAASRAVKEARLATYNLLYGPGAPFGTKDHGIKAFKTVVRSEDSYEK